MAAQSCLFLCLKDNFGVLLHDPETMATAAIDAPAGSFSPMRRATMAVAAIDSPIAPQ